MLRLGFIGVGGYGWVQVEAFHRLQSEGAIKITCVADPSSSHMERLKELPGLQEAQRFTDYRELLAYPELDAVVISTPIPLHYEMVKAALKRGLYILLEKPPVASLRQLDDLVEADVNRRIMVGFQHIYSDLIHNAKRWISEGALGRIKAITARGLWPRDTGYYSRSKWAGQLFWHGEPVFDGPCTNAMAHHVNIVHYLGGKDLNSFALPLEVTGEVYRARTDIQTYDTACLLGSFSDDTRFFIGFSHSSTVVQLVEMEIRGERGTWILKDNCSRLVRPNEEDIVGDDGRNGLRRSFIEFANGNTAANRTSIDHVRSYVLTTNLMLFSSKGVHPIPEKFVRVSSPSVKETVFEVDNLPSYLTTCFSNLQSFSQADIPWARKTEPVRSAEFSEEKLFEMLGFPGQ